MKRMICAFAVAALFVGCAKETPTPTNQSNDLITFSSKNVTVSGLKVAEKINGIVTCTVDEDVLRSAISMYYGGQTTKEMEVVEYNEGTPLSFFVMEGRVRANKQWYRYAFELIPNPLADGTLEFYLPVAGTEQHLYGPGSGASQLILTSTSSGYGASQNSIYGSSTSTVSTDTFGTNKLVSLILQLN